MKAKIILTIVCTFVLLIINSQSVFSQTTFSSSTDFATGTNAYAVTTGDINGDGKPDMIVVNYNSSNKVSVYLNTTTPGASTPTFSAKTDFTTGSFPNSVKVADLNGDGKPDIVVSNNSSNSLSVLLNTTTIGAATPTFSAKTDLSTGTTPLSVVIADFNGDGKPDLTVANTNSTSVSVFLNTTTTGAATASFSAKTDFTTGSHPNSVSIGDLNGDGKPDIAVVNAFDATVSVLLNTTTTGAATPTFSAKTDFTTGNTTSSVSVGDLNGDGKPDIAAGNASSNTISVLLNTTSSGASTPTFSAKTDFTTGQSPRSVNITDINGDGKPDMLVANSNTNTVSVYINTTAAGSASPTFTDKLDYTTATGVFYVAVNDVNLDGRPDILTANGISSSASVLLNTTTLGAASPSFTAKTDFSTGTNCSYVAVGNINGDGLPDLVEANANANTVSIFLNTTTPGTTTPTFSAKTDFTTGTNPRSVAIKDFNGDGKPDLVFTNYSATSISVCLNTTTPGASTPTMTARTNFTTGNNPYVVTTGDVNLDGKPDIVVNNYGSTTVSVFLNTTTPGASTPTFTAKKDFATGTFPYAVALGDINGDGKPDMAVANYGAATVSVYINTTTPGSTTAAFTAKTDFNTNLSPNSVTFGDLNSDGQPDLALTNFDGSAISVLLNNTTAGSSTPSFGTKTDFTTGGNPYGVAITDINGDCKPDLTAVVGGTNKFSVFLNTTTPDAATPTFSARTDYTAGLTPISPAIADLNGDGLPDLVSGNYSSNSFSVLMNTAVLPLPVELTSFTSIVKGNDVTLNWSTVQEQNNRGFEIEKSSFSTGWKKIGYIDGHGTTNTPQNYSFAERGLTTGSYHYRLKQIDYNGNYEYHELNSEVIIGVPSKFALAQNYPNPFNPSTIINYQLAINSFVSLKVYDISGREVSSLVNEVKNAGYYSVTFDAKNLSSGAYFYKLSTAKFSDVKKMVVMK